MILLIAAAAVTLAAVLIVIVSGEMLSRAHLQPWSKDYHTRFGDPRMQLVAHGLLAANGHNMQPWLIELGGDPLTLDLYADSGRLNPEVDPFARQSMITQGTFLESMEVAAQKLGYSLDIELFPQGECDERGSEGSLKSHPVARIKLTKSKPASGEIYDALFQPDTARVPYDKAGLSLEQARQLQSIGQVGPARLRLITDQADRKRLVELASEAARIEVDVPEISAANSRLLRTNAWQKSKHRYGFSLDGSGMSGVKLAILETLLTLAPGLNSPNAARSAFLKQTEEALESTPAFALILTSDNTRTSQVRAGMLYTRFQLTCQTMGLGVQPLSQSQEEYEEMKATREALHEEFAEHGETVQLLVRLGKPIKPVPHSMRRDATDLLINK